MFGGETWKVLVALREEETRCAVVEGTDTKDRLGLEARKLGDRYREHQGHYICMEQKRLGLADQQERNSG